MDAEIQGLDHTSSLESVSTADDMPLMPLPGTQMEAAGEAEQWDGTVARRETRSSHLLNSLFNFVSNAASSVIGFLGEQARSLASAISMRPGIAEENPNFGVWDSERDENAGGPLGEVGDRDRPRRGRRPMQPPGLASQALRELRDAESETEDEAQPDAAGRRSPMKNGAGSGHVLAQLSCSKASTAVCAAAAAALARAAATTAARNAAAAASTVPATPVTAKDLRPERVTASSSHETCLRIADYPTVIPLKPTATKPSTISNEDVNSEEVVVEAPSVDDPPRMIISTAKRSGDSIHDLLTFTSDNYEPPPSPFRNRSVEETNAQSNEMNVIRNY